MPVSYTRIAAALALGIIVGLGAGLPLAWQIDRALAPEWAE